MRLAHVSLILTVAGLIFTGCKPPEDPLGNRLGPARDVINASVQAIGSLPDWQKVTNVSATAIVASYDADGNKTVDRLMLNMDIWGGVITADGASPQGAWSARVSDDGTCTTTGSPSLGKEALCRELGTILHRVRGPLNMLAEREQVLSAHRDRVDGINVNRVAVEGRGKTKMVYYFDAATNLLRFVSEGDETPGSKGTVTIYGQRESYAALPNGLTMPRKFRVVKVGQHVMIGDKPVLDVELSDITVQKSQ
ncbi:MAG: hypothetical protein EHM48_04485 [Planctomycetaceae bacterium]|nr:MAG: hypothetical protein EHM48_04485 [Planctomycetaceae bacterium]